MHQPVDGGECHGLVWKDAPPCAKGLVCRDQQGTLFVSCGDQFEQYAGFGLILGDIGDIVKDEQIVAVELCDGAFKGELASGQLQALHEIGGAGAVLLLDQAGWQLSGEVNVPTNITLLPLPPKCPELNVMQNIWQFMRDNWLSNRVFRHHDDIVDHCCHAWNKLISQPWRIMSIGLRKWAHGY
jgi:hypothetical protein